MGKPLNICILSQEFPPYTNWGGIAAYNSELSKVFARMGHSVTVISRMEADAPPFEERPDGVKVWRVGAAIRRKYFVGRTIDRILHAESVYRKVQELEEKGPFDIIETTEAGLEGERLLTDEKFRDRMVIQCNGSNALGIIPSGSLAFLHKLDWKWSYLREQRSLRLVPRIIVTSRATSELLSSQGIDSNRIRLIYQGVDTERFTPRRTPLPLTPLEIGFAGRLEELKGIDFIWNIMERIGPNSGMRFHFKGKIHPSAKEEVDAKLHRFKAFAIYHQPGGHNEMQDYYQSLHVLLQPSRFENFGLVYAEALACGLIVFAGKGGSGGEVIKDGVTGFVVDPDLDAEPVVARLREIAANPAAFEHITHAGRSDVVARFSLESCARQKIQFYSESLNGAVS